LGKRQAANDPDFCGLAQVGERAVRDDGFEYRLDFGRQSA
jgi:hypothetical protein